MKIFKTIYPYFYAFWIFLSWAIWVSLDSIFDSPVLVIIGLGLAYFGSVIGMTIHMIQAKAWK